MKYFLILMFTAFTSVAQMTGLEDLPNSCLINSIEMYEKVCYYFDNNEMWNTILIFKFKDPRNPRYTEGHAICVFEWHGHFYVYDVNQGSWRLDTRGINVKNNPIGTAKLIYPRHRVLDADYLR